MRSKEVGKEEMRRRGSVRLQMVVPYITTSGSGAGATGDGTVTASSFSALASASKITTALLLFSLDCDNQHQTVE